MLHEQTQGAVGIGRGGLVFEFMQKQTGLRQQQQQRQHQTQP